MTNNGRQQAKLLLEDGTLFTGTAIGKIGTKGGEICFNTGMTGYQEIYTDPSYYGQIVVNTTSHIGNYGVVDDEQESSYPKISALVVNSFSEDYSRKLARDALQVYLEKRQHCRHCRYRYPETGTTHSLQRCHECYCFLLKYWMKKP